LLVGSKAEEAEARIAIATYPKLKVDLFQGGLEVAIAWNVLNAGAQAIIVTIRG
jgi:hypothetical protein